MKDWKLILGVIGGSVLLVLIMIFGLTKMSAGGGLPKVEESVLLDGARFVKENGETKVAVVVFSDIQCPACRSANEKLKAIRDIPGVKLVFRHFPLNIHTYSQQSGQAVEAARIMGKGHEMMDLLFEKQDEWANESKIEDKLTFYAMSLGLEETEFRKNYASKEVKNFVQLDADLANRLQLPGTPTIFVNGEQVASDFVEARVKELLKN